MDKYILVSKPSINDTRFALDIANALLIGSIDEDTTFTKFQFFNSGALQSATLMKNQVITIETDVIPSNSEADKFFLRKDDSTKTKFLNTNDKVIQGSLFVCVAPLGPEQIDSGMNQIRKICESVQAFSFYEELIVEIGTEIEFDVRNWVCFSGYLKETQTDDYNPLDQIPIEYKRDFVMLPMSEASPENIAQSIEED